MQCRKFAAGINLIFIVELCLLGQAIDRKDCVDKEYSEG